MLEESWIYILIPVTGKSFLHIIYLIDFNILCVQLPDHLVEMVSKKRDVPDIIRELDDFSVCLGFDNDQCLAVLKVKFKLLKMQISSDYIEGIWL